MAAKVRFHKGLSAALRLRAREMGISLDEEMAQHVLAGERPLQGLPQAQLSSRRDEVLATSWADFYRGTWESEHEGANPYAPSFPDRVLALVRKALQESNSDDGSPVYYLNLLEQMCTAELKTDNFTPDETLEIED